MRGLLVCLALAACSTTPGFRSVSTRITSIALFDQVRFSGQWDVVASYSGQLCGVSADAGQTGAFDWVERQCSGRQTHNIAQITGPGRFTIKGGVHSGQEHWVLWVDHAYRTAVIGTPDGTFGMILNRGRDIPTDRLNAAREILDWNGYDLALLINRTRGK